jgi:RHS repeat-associated protein
LEAQHSGQPPPRAPYAQTFHLIRSVNDWRVFRNNQGQLAGGADPDFSYFWTYDGAGRAASVTYPGGFTYRNVYDTRGYLHQVTDASAALVYWQAEQRDAAGHVLEEQLGNGLRTHRTYRPDTQLLDTLLTGPLSGGVLTASVQNDVYTFDRIGNLETRSQYVGGNSLVETFGYDNLNRLTSAQLVNGAISSTKTAAYDELGNVTSRSDVGTYSYAGCGGAHRVCAINAGAAFAYDDNGNMTGGNGRSYTWTSFNMPLTVAKGTVTDTYRYNTAHERTSRVSVDSATSETTTTVTLNPRLDLGGTWELTYLPDGTRRSVQHVYASSQAIANVTITTDTGGTTTSTYYLHTDHLGSVVATTDGSGTVIERMSFDAWGKRRHIDGTDDAANALASSSTIHGYTGHEQLDGMDLVHMNGRLYDPLIGRFVSADPNVFYPDNLQDYNVYSYVHNNPLSATDPSGFAWTMMDDVMMSGVTGVPAGPGLDWFLRNSSETFESGWMTIGNDRYPGVTTGAGSFSVSYGHSGGSGAKPGGRSAFEHAAPSTGLWGRAMGDESGFGGYAESPMLLDQYMFGTVMSEEQGVQQPVSVLGGSSSVWHPPSSLTSWWPSGVLAISTEGTVVEGVFGLKGGTGINFDFSTGNFSVHTKMGSGLSGHDGALLGGVDFQAAISVDYAPSMEYFAGSAVETGFSIGFFGLDVSIVPGKGPFYGFDIGPGLGSSAVKTETNVW